MIEPSLSRTTDSSLTRMSDLCLSAKAEHRLREIRLRTKGSEEEVASVLQWFSAANAYDVLNAVLETDIGDMTRVPTSQHHFHPIEFSVLSKIRDGVRA